MKSPHTITQFCNEVWLALHEPNSSFPRKECGLCYNLKNWAFDKMHPLKRQELERKIHSKFPIPDMFPFNSETNHYFEEKDKFKNKKRLYWIYTHTRGIPMLNTKDINPYDIPLQVLKIDNLFCIGGTEYGYYYTAGGDIRTWKTRDSAMRFLKKYCQEN